jgi:pyrimidine operon attenuation protein/uracil phosphoribosyltransferase
MPAPDTISDAADIQRILTRMCHEMLEVHRGIGNLALIGIQTRGVFLARRLQAQLRAIEGAAPPVGEMDITLYRDDWTRIDRQPRVQATAVPFNVEDCKIVLVDDVLFTGRTVRAAMDALMDFGRPERIELAVLVDRGHRELPIRADYIGKLLETRRTQMVNVLLTEVDGRDAVELT